MLLRRSRRVASSRKIDAVPCTPRHRQVQRCGQTLPLNQESSRGRLTAASGVMGNSPVVPARDCFEQPAAVRADERVGDVRMTRSVRTRAILPRRSRSCVRSRRRDRIRVPRRRHSASAAAASGGPDANSSRSRPLALSFSTPASARFSVQRQARRHERDGYRRRTSASGRPRAGAEAAPRSARVATNQKRRKQ